MSAAESQEKEGIQYLSSILKSYFYQYPHAMFITDRSGRIEFINPVFESLSGYDRNELIGKNPKFFQSGSHDARFYENLWNTILSGKEYEGNFVNKNGFGKTVSWKERITPLRDESGNISNFLCRVDLPQNGNLSETNGAESPPLDVSGERTKIRESLFPKLQKEFGLTYQEAKICDLLVEGQTRDNLVKQLGVHAGTLKNHLKSIYRKTIERNLAEPGQGRDKLQRLTLFLIRLC